MYVNLVGGQDELVFDGASMVVGADGTVLARRGSSTRTCSSSTSTCAAPTTGARPPAVRRRSRSPTVAVSESHLGLPSRPPRVEPLLDPVHEVYRALVLGTRDYVEKNGFTHVVLGLSGGIDSSLVAAIAADALGPEKVTGVLMPSRYSSEGSITDADALARNLGIQALTIPIEPAHEAFTEMLAETFAGTEPGLAEENLQARVRGTILDDDVEQVRLARAHHRQQERDGHRLLHALRRHGRWLRGDQGRPEDARLRALRGPQPARRTRDRAAHGHREAAERRAAPGPEGRGLAPALRGARPDHRGLRGGRPLHRRSRCRRLRPRHRGSGSRGSSTAPSTSAARPPPGVRVSTKAFGKDRRLPITNRWPG